MTSTKKTERTERRILATATEWKLIRDFTRYIKSSKNKAAIQAILSEVQTHSSCSHVLNDGSLEPCPICRGDEFHFIISFDDGDEVHGEIRCSTCSFSAETVMTSTPRFFSHKLLLDAMSAWNEKVWSLWEETGSHVLKAWKADLLTGAKEPPLAIGKEELLECIEHVIASIESDKNQQAKKMTED